MKVLGVIIVFLFGTHVLIGMAPMAEFTVQVWGVPAGCDSTGTADSDSLGILSFHTTCLAGTVSVWRVETGVDLPWWSAVVPWALVEVPLWW